MRRANSLRSLLTLAVAGFAASLGLQAQAAGPACGKPVYLTFDTGHMGVAPLIADVLRREQVKVTFFLANEPTRTGGSSLDDEWAAWWRERAAEGHDAGSHTWDHLVWLADTPAGFRMKATALPGAPVKEVSAAQYCEQLKRPAERYAAITGQPMRALFRAPAGRTSPKLLAVARQCGFEHVAWAPAGFLGDELPSERFPNDRLLAKALREIRPGDILVAHLGIWSRQDPWAPAVLEPLLAGLEERGFCFATLRDHPVYGAAK
jgi:peptidoglycan/xylan/chitin deacetylase (PgdA/CDA1 family)